MSPIYPLSAQQKKSWTHYQKSRNISSLTKLASVAFLVHSMLRKFSTSTRASRRSSGRLRTLTYSPSPLLYYAATESTSVATRWPWSVKIVRAQSKTLRPREKVIIDKIFCHIVLAPFLDSILIFETVCEF